MPLHVYGVVAADHPLPTLDGVGASAPPVRLVAHAAVAAVVSALEEAAELEEDDAVRHLDVLGELVLGGAVLPLPFGTVAPDEEAVRSEVLAPVADDLRVRLEALDGLVEVRVDVALDEDAELRAVLADEPQLAAASRNASGNLDQRIRVGEVVAARLADRRKARVEDLFSSLPPLAEDAVRVRASDPAVDRLALLVRLEELSQLDAAVEELRHAAGPDVSLEYVGPLPAYSFLERVAPVAQEPEPSSRWGW